MLKLVCAKVEITASRIAAAVVLATARMAMLSPNVCVPRPHAARLVSARRSILALSNGGSGRWTLAGGQLQEMIGMVKVPTARGSRVALFVGAMATALLTAGTGAAANPANCRNTGTFEAWKRDARPKLAATGISERTLRAGFDPVTFDQTIIQRDRRQSFFARTFIDFSTRLVSNNRLTTARRKLDQQAALFRRAEREYGVPGPVIAAFWALESDFGVGLTKKYPILNSLATLAYDCRRPALFEQQLIAALKLVDNGRVPLSRMEGAWAGEIGETQFLPIHVLNFGVDGDGDGRIDLYDSDADIIMSTANKIRGIGWRAGEPWLEEVQVPADMPWQEADLAIQHPVAKWSQWGVRTRDGGRLDANGPPASLLLPMGRNGPAFLGYRNFQIYPQWNESLNYAITAAYFATRLAGAPRYRDGRGPIEEFDLAANKQVQELLVRRGYDTGGIDGMLGARSRAAIKAAQIKFGLPADSYPSRALVERLQRRP